MKPPLHITADKMEIKDFLKFVFSNFFYPQTVRRLLLYDQLEWKYNKQKRRKNNGERYFKGY